MANLPMASAYHVSLATTLGIASAWYAQPLVRCALTRPIVRRALLGTTSRATTVCQRVQITKSLMAPSVISAYPIALSAT